MKIPLIMIFSFVTVIAVWAKKALEDGKISTEEAFDLLTKLAGLLGVPLSFDIPPKVNEAIETAAKTFNASGNAADILSPDYKDPTK